MNTSVDFKSDLFKPFLPEDSQVNPEVYGAELAYWLCRKLAEKKIITTYPNNEDWGWFIEYFVDDYEYWLCCSNVNSSNSEWRCFLKPHSTNFFGTRKAPVENALPLLTALNDVLVDEAGISEIQWSDGEAN